MNTSSTNQFGLMVAYLLPGFIALAGVAPFAPVVAAWLQPLNQSEASLAAPVYAVLAATTIGMVVSCFRWLIIDHIHHWSGVKPPAWDDSRLEKRIGAFNYLVENHYRYYQFYANILIAVAIAYLINRVMGTSSLFGMGTDLGFLVVSATLFAGSRDALNKYYRRTTRLIGQTRKKGSAAMTNGNQHDSGGATATSRKPRPDAKPQNASQVVDEAKKPKRESTQSSK
jgi:hypothetical protein